MVRAERNSARWSAIAFVGSARADARWSAIAFVGSARAGRGPVPPTTKVPIAEPRTRGAGREKRLV